MNPTNTSQLGPYIANKYINVVISHKPKFRFDPDTYVLPDGGPKAIFDQRFIVISDKNIKETAEKYPELFPKK